MPKKKLPAELRYVADGSAIPQVIASARLPRMGIWVDRLLGSNAMSAMDELWQWRYTKALFRSSQQKYPCFLPNDKALILRMIGAPAEAIDDPQFAILLEQFEVTSDGQYLFNRRALIEHVIDAYNFQSHSERGQAAPTAVGAIKKITRLLPQAMAQLLPRPIPNRGRS